MRISDWSSDVCSSDLVATAWNLDPAHRGAMLANRPREAPRHRRRDQRVLGTDRDQQRSRNARGFDAVGAHGRGERLHPRHVLLLDRLPYRENTEDRPEFRLLIERDAIVFGEAVDDALRRLVREPVERIAEAFGPAMQRNDRKST